MDNYEHFEYNGRKYLLAPERNVNLSSLSSALNTTPNTTIKENDLAIYSKSGKEYFVLVVKIDHRDQCAYIRILHYPR